MELENIFIYSFTQGRFCRKIIGEVLFTNCPTEKQVVLEVFMLDLRCILHIVKVGSGQIAPMVQYQA